MVAVSCGVGQTGGQSQAGPSLSKLALVDQVLEVAEISGPLRWLTGRLFVYRPCSRLKV